MKKLFNLVPMIGLFLSLFCQNAWAQEINMVDEKNFYEVEMGTDGPSLVVTIDGMRKVADFEQGSGLMPKYLGKYKNSLVFMDEVSR